MEKESLLCKRCNTQSTREETYGPGRLSEKAYIFETLEMVTYGAGQQLAEFAFGLLT